MKKYILALFLFMFIIPSVSYAVWWNPATWVNKKPQDTGITSIINETKIYSSVKGGYSVVYPSGWPIAIKSDSTNYSDFKIKNSSSAVLPGSNSQLRDVDSIISINVVFGKLPNGIDYSNYPTISEIIKDPKFGQVDTESRLKKVSDMKIGGKNLKVMKLGNSMGISYAFVYKNKAYQMNIMSGSKDQYKKDVKVFNDMISSFKFTDSSTSTTVSNNKNDVTNQRAYLSKIYKKDNKNYIDVDYIQVFSGDASLKAQVEDGKCLNIKDCYDFPNGYKRNVNPLIRTFEVSSDATIRVYGNVGMRIFNNNTNSNSPISFDQLMNEIVKSDIKNNYINIDVKDNKVIKITEPYQE